MHMPIQDLFPEAMVFIEGPWESASLRSRHWAVSMVFEDVFKLDTGLALTVSTLTQQQTYDRMVWSLRSGRVHCDLMPHLYPLEHPSCLESWRERQWRENPATPIELVFPELMARQPAGVTWASLNPETRIARLRLLAFDMWGRRRRMNDRPQGVSPEVEIAMLEDAIRRDELPDDLMSGAVCPGRVDIIEWR